MRHSNIDLIERYYFCIITVSSLGKVRHFEYRCIPRTSLFYESIAEISKDDIFKPLLFSSHFSGKRLNESSTVERHKAFDGQGKQIYG